VSGLAKPAERGFAQRLSPLIAALGVTAVPNLLLRYQGRLGLTSNEMIYVQHVLMHRWDDAWPWVATQVIVDATGAAERSVRDWKASLIAKGYLQVRTRGRAGGGRGADEHNLSRLFAALEAVALEDEIQRATEQAREQLPNATYYRASSGPHVMAPTARKLQTQRVRDRSIAAENRRIIAAENRPPNLPESARSKRQIPASEEETRDKSLLLESSHEKRNGLAAASQPPGFNEDQLLTELLKIGAPGHYDEGIELQIEQCSAEFEDNDLQRSIDSAHHMWWNSKLDPGRFQNAVKAAIHVTRKRRGQITDRPMAYFFKVLAAAVMDQRYRAGLPVEDRSEVEFAAPSKARAAEGVHEGGPATPRQRRKHRIEEPKEVAV